MGGMPEWLKGAGCKPVGYAYVGSNPTPSTIHTKMCYRQFLCFWHHNNRLILFCIFAVF